MERVVRIVSREDPAAELAHWLSRPAGERISAVEALRASSYRVAGLNPAARLEKVFALRDRIERPA